MTDTPGRRGENFGSGNFSTAEADTPAHVGKTFTKFGSFSFFCLTPLPTWGKLFVVEKPTTMILTPLPTWGKLQCLLVRTSRQLDTPAHVGKTLSKQPETGEEVRKHANPD